MLIKLINFIRSRIRKFLFDEIWIKDCIKRGMIIGKNCSIQPGVVFDYSHCWLIRLGNNVTIAPFVYILAHDASTKRFFGYTKVGSVVISDNVFIGARSIIMPGITVGENSIIGAGSIVTESVLPNTIVAGIPARKISTLDEYNVKMNNLIEKSILYGSEYTINGNISNYNKMKMYSELINSIGFIV